MKKRPSWNQQICTIENKGYQAFIDGIPESENPYLGGEWNCSGVGGNLQRQRRQAWNRGWEMSKRDKPEGQGDESKPQ